ARGHGNRRAGRLRRPGLHREPGQAEHARRATAQRRPLRRVVRLHAHPRRHSQARATDMQARRSVAPGLALAGLVSLFLPAAGRAAITSATVAPTGVAFGAFTQKATTGTISVIYTGT